jgi:hypothetical protein
MNHHVLKCLAPYYQHVIDGDKTFEVRKNDREFKMGDTILLMEITTEDRAEYTGREKVFQITYILKGGKFGIKDDYCILGIKPLKR